MRECKHSFQILGKIEEVFKGFCVMTAGCRQQDVLYCLRLMNGILSSNWVKNGG
jgi:hypothetical protein